jgi:N-acetylglucosamine-6-phosphate deacetylase
LFLPFAEYLARKLAGLELNGVMTPQFITNVRMVLPGESIERGSLLVVDGKIAELNAPAAPANAVTIDGAGQILSPGLIDLHTHGIHQFRYHHDTSAENFAAAAKVLARYGTTCVFPTIVPGIEDDLADNFRGLPAVLSQGGGAWMPGLHLEGPFLALGGAACATLPGNLKLLDDLVAACAGRISIMSISPDQKNILAVIRRLRELGIVPFITHTRASVEETAAAIDAGALHATHFYDVFPAPEETDPGVRPVGAVETILADKRVSVDFIGDGVHVHPMAIRAAVCAKGWRQIVLITDSNIGAGLEEGEYDSPWGYKVAVKRGDGVRHATKKFLAGSALTMNAGLKNLMRWLDLPPEQIWAMGTLNPARVLGLEQKGRIAVGTDADLVLWNEDLSPVKTWVGGRCIYEYEKDL